MAGCHRRSVGRRQVAGAGGQPDGAVGFDGEPFADRVAEYRATARLLDLIRVVVLSRAQLRAIVENKPKGFGDSPDSYLSDVIFLMGITPSRAMKVFDPREGVDVVTPGTGVIWKFDLNSAWTRASRSWPRAGGCGVRSPSPVPWSCGRRSGSPWTGWCVPAAPL